MRKSKRPVLFAAAILGILILLPLAVWVGLTRQPDFYARQVAIPVEVRKHDAQKFVAHGMRLRNAIMNEPRWEAAFSDQEVNSWLAEDLVTHFADQIPQGVHEPRVVFEPNRATFAFQLDQGPVRSVVWVVVSARMAEQNVLALTIEKIRAGVMPIPAEKLLEPIAAHARARGLEIRWEQDGDLPVALIRYDPNAKRSDVVLEKLEILDGQIRLSGRSDRSAGQAAALMLPSRKSLQSRFPKRTSHSSARSASPVSARQSASLPFH
jgi:hypothetical protein